MKNLALEIRDDHTFIPACAVLMIPEVGLAEKTEAQRYLLRRVGYPMGRPQVILFRLSGNGAAYSDPYQWDNRTMQVAHQFILDNFGSLRDGAVIDVQFIVGETREAKQSERLTAYPDPDPPEAA